MPRAAMTSEDYRRKITVLRATVPAVQDARLVALNRAVRKVLGNPSVARSVAQRLRKCGAFKP